jgi:hypothetical protein
MKQATARDKPDTFKSPSGLMAANVCRESGRLPGPFCTRVVTEYFARGTAPTEVCQDHNFYLAAHLATTLPDGTVRATEAFPTAPPSPSAPVAAVSSAARDNDVVMASKTEEEPKKKRGFWSKVFGRGKDDEKKEKKAND